MKNNIQNFFDKNVVELFNECRPYIPSKRIECKDGFSMSVQDGFGTYSGNGTFEVGFPNIPEPLLVEYIDDKDDINRQTETVYAYVPIDVINSIIANHGGIKND